MFRVTTLETKHTVLQTCFERKDEWAEVVRARILHVHDLPAADVICHQACSVNFRTKKQILMQFASEQRDVKKRKIGRPQDEEKNDAFLKVARFLQENDDEQITVVDLVEKMEEYLGDLASTAYGRTHMKARLQEHFGDQIIITEINGKPNVVTFRSTVDNILHDFHDLLFLHAILGCDTTSRVHGIGKAAALKKYANSLHFREQAKVFNSPSAVDDIVVAGGNAPVSLYGGKPGEKLDGMRYQRYCEKLATNSSQIQPQYF